MQVAFGTMSVGGWGGEANLFKANVAEEEEEKNNGERGNHGAMAYMEEEEAYRRTTTASTTTSTTTTCNERQSDIYDDSGEKSCVMMTGEHKQSRRSAMVAMVKTQDTLDGMIEVEEVEGLVGGGDCGEEAGYAFLEEDCGSDSDEDIL